MEKYSLLDMVQLILNDMDGDNVNSIDDTTESMQVAQIVKQNYNTMLSVGDWPHLKKFGKLRSANDLSRPTHMRLPKDTYETISINYNAAKQTDDNLRYRRVEYVAPEEFVRRINGRPSSNNHVVVVEDPLVDLLVMNDRAPSMWTSFDDSMLVFDSYDLAVESALQASNSQVLYYATNEFDLVDDFVPSLPPEMFSQLLEQSKANAFVVLKGTENPDASYKASRLRRWTARKAWKAHGKPKLPNYGRK